MAWWIWVVLGLALFAAESLLPFDFYLAFIGLAALTVGLVSAAASAIPLSAQLALFSVVAAASLVFLRKPLVRRLSGGGSSGVGSERLIGEVATLMEDLAAGGVGRAELRGTVWKVRSSDARLLREGERCRVRRVEGLTLWVSPEEN